MNIFRLRLLEWVASFILFATGLIMLLSPLSFHRSETLAPFADNAITWTVVCLGVGIARLLALYVNGHWVGGTPLLRMLGSLAGIVVFGAFVGNLLGTSTLASVSWGIAIYSGLMLGELCNGFFSAVDVFNAKRR